MKRLAHLWGCLRVGLWGCLSIGALSAPLAAAAIDHASLVTLSASVLKVEAERVQGGFSLGSAVVVGPETVVTNCHVTRDAKRIAVARGGVRWQAATQFRDADHDLCVLQVPGLRADVIRAGRADALKIGEPVIALGFTGGGMQNSDGRVLALHRLDGARVIQSSNWFNSGASGGGLFDEQLRLVGILTFRSRGGDAHYYAAPVEWLTGMLDRTSPQFEPIAPSTASEPAYWERPAARQPAFLKAELLQREQQWPALESLARDWLNADTSDPEGWYLLGVALDEQHRPAAARTAFECSLQADGDHASASERLATLPPNAAAPVLADATPARCSPGALTSFPTR